MLRSRRWFFPHPSRSWRSTSVDLFPGLLTCVMAGLLGYTMIHSPRPLPLRFWLTLDAYAIGGMWYLFSAIGRIWTKRSDVLLLDRFESGLCQRCGFDLRACTSVRCSECGTWHGKLPARRFTT